MAKNYVSFEEIKRRTAANNVQKVVSYIPAPGTDSNRDGVIALCQYYFGNDIQLIYGKTTDPDYQITVKKHTHEMQKNGTFSMPHTSATIHASGVLKAQITAEFNAQEGILLTKLFDEYVSKP